MKTSRLRHPDPKDVGLGFSEDMAMENYFPNLMGSFHDLCLVQPV